MRFADMRSGCYEPQARLADMDVARIERSLCFPNYPRFAGQMFKIMKAYAPPPQQPAAPAQDDMLTQLQKLGELKAAGVLTEEEFAAQKAKILAG